MRLCRLALLTCCCLALAGCSAFGRKQPGGGGGGSTRPSAEPPPTPPVATRPLEPNGGGTTGMLAGQVMNSFATKPGSVYIQVSLVREGNETQSAPVEVAADGQGYFTIMGLQPGRHYQLVARTEDGSRKLAGTVWVTPPNPRVIIRISEDNATPQTPPIPPVPVYPGTKPPAPSWPEDKAPPAEEPAPAASAEQGWTPTPAPRDTKPGGAGLGTPVKIDDAPPAAPASPTRPESTATGPRRPREAPTVRIPGPAPTPAPAPVVPPSPATEPPAPAPPAPTPPTVAPALPSAAPPPPAASSTPVVPAPVPSCSLTGQTLNNFALYDVDGQPWEFRQHKARLTLIDFWGTWCTHCVQAIPHLKTFQEYYANYGLQVVGIAYEEGTFPEQVQKVNRIRQRLGINYTMLMGNDTYTCPVRTQFNIRAYPTLVLVDENGRIIWRGQGMDKQHLAELDGLIRQRLGVR